MRKRSISVFCMGLVAISLLSIIVGVLPVEADSFVPQVQTMSTEQVRPGMKGTAYTVVRGNRLVSFPVEVISILPRKGIPQNLIMIRASGPVIEETGGIAAGMSGSPVYIEGKLIGAIGYGWNFTEHDLGLVTPIEDMSAIWDLPEEIPSLSPPPVLRWTESSLMVEHEPISADPADIGSIDLTEQDYGSSRTTFFADGISSRAAERISVNLGKDVSLVGGSTVGELPVEYNPSLRPGEAIGVMLAWGDVSMGATGTLTALSKDGRFLAFAHPFLNRGYGAYPLTRSWIHNVVPSIQAPFKVGSPLSIIGSVTQDRAQAIGGRIGLFLPSVDASVRLRDIDHEKSSFKRFHMAQDPFLISDILPDVALGIIDESWGRKGEGTVRMNIEIEGRGLENGWERTNYFFSDKDIAKESLKEVQELTQVLSLNPFREIMPLGIHLDMEITSRPKVLFIEGLSINKKEARPGDEITVVVLLRPYRKA
ncbi:MAG TPA: SpoIVB peptidase S55 domain-containing protein [Synergistales bacterium]|nr:SpoIVB peptidase S55 domain-containing protein [Synergistales bacterium]